MKGARAFLSWIVTSVLTIGLGFAAAGLVHASAPAPSTSTTSVPRTARAPSGSSVTPATSPVPYVAGHDDGFGWSGSASRASGVSSLGAGDGAGDH